MPPPPFPPWTHLRDERYVSTQDRFFVLVIILHALRGEDAVQLEFP
jgi:hypothetical protein